MVEEAVQHELETLRRLVLESSPVSRNELESSLTAFKDQTTLVRTLNTRALNVKSKGRHKQALLRIESVEIAQKTFEDNLNRVPTQLDREAGRLTDLFDEKLKQANLRIDNFSDYVTAARDAAKEAIDAAFSAAKELTSVYNTSSNAAVAKSEHNTNKEIDNIKSLIGSTNNALNVQIDNLADRMNRNEGFFAGGKGAISVIISVVAAAGIYVSMHTSPTVGADTRRVDDLISVINEQNRQIGQRMDALSARINTLTPKTP